VRVDRALGAGAVGAFVFVGAALGAGAVGAFVFVGAALGATDAKHTVKSPQPAFLQPPRRSTLQQQYTVASLVSAFSGSALDVPRQSDIVWFFRAICQQF
jgi:hypothetical protein